MPDINAYREDTKFDSDIIVIGAGLAGLTAANLLFEAGHKITLLEASNEPGGRVKSLRDEMTGTYIADLGATWVWPEYQPTVERWLDRLGLETIPQFDSGPAVIEFDANSAPVIDEVPAQTGNVRIRGGTQAIIDGLLGELPTNTVQTNTTVTAVNKERNGVELMTTSDTASVYHAKKLVVAVPPRIAVSRISWRPMLGKNAVDALNIMPTWMAPHAKVVALYKTPFWRERGLSGRILSRVGPIVEAHDHSGIDGAPAALFGFVGWPHDLRSERRDILVDDVVKQLSRCFGQDAPQPDAVHIQDWATNPFVAVADDLSTPGEHPHVGPAVLRQLHFDGCVCFAAAETATQSPGLIEGAFVAGEHAAMLVG